MLQAGGRLRPGIHCYRTSIHPMGWIDKKRGTQSDARRKVTWGPVCAPSPYLPPMVRI